mgnify:CR=1 FL=1
MTFRLYGTPGSLYTGKARSYLIKKQVPYVELMASDPRFLGEIVPAVGHMVIPVVETPSGELIQDTAAIIDHIEARRLQCLCNLKRGKDAENAIVASAGRHRV